MITGSAEDYPVRRGSGRLRGEADRERSFSRTCPVRHGGPLLLRTRTKGCVVQHTIEYVDPVEGFHGYLVYHGHGCRIAAGGCRVQPGLSPETLRALAARMLDKQRLLGLAVDGARCGSDYDPRSPGKAAARGRFLAFLRQELGSRLSMGCDMGTGWHELEMLAAAQGIPSVKYAIRAAQELPEAAFFDRLHLLDERVGQLTVGQCRTGHALGHAALAAAAHLGLRPAGLRCAVQGFADLGRAAAGSLVEAGATVTAVSDEFGCVVDPTGLDVSAMLALPAHREVRSMHVGRASLPRQALFDLPADVLVLADGSDAVPLDIAAAASVSPHDRPFGAGRYLNAGGPTRRRLPAAA